MANKPSLGLGTKLGAAAVRHGDNKGDLNVNLMIRIIICIHLNIDYRMVI